MYELLTGETFRPAAYPAEPRLRASLERAGLVQSQAMAKEVTT